MTEVNGTSVETFVWKGQTRYRCPGRWESGAKCEYDCSSIEQLAAHMKTPHMRELKQEAPKPFTVPASAADTEKAAPEFKGASFASDKSNEPAPTGPVRSE